MTKKQFDPILLRCLSVILAFALLIIFLSFINYLLDKKIKIEPVEHLFFLLPFLCIYNYCQTFWYSNELQKSIHSKQKKYFFFLTLCILSFLISLLLLILISFLLYQAYLKNNFLFKITGIKQFLEVTSTSIFCTLGPLFFFLQIKLRTTLITRHKNSFIKEINSIGEKINL